MKKIISVLMLALLLFVVSGCKQEVVEEERTYKADGTYMVWRLSTADAKVLLADGSANYKDKDNKDVTVKTPVLSTLTVTIYNDEVVKFYIDELQSKAYVSGTAEDGSLTKVLWKFNASSKKELGYAYGMEKNAAQGEWFLQVSNLERNWLVNEPAELSTVTIHHDVYVEMAKEALQNAKDGKVGAIVNGEHYPFDVAFVTGKVNEEGKISDIKLDAQLFANGGKTGSAYDPATPFAWNPGTKYDTYGPMSDSKKWQDQIDVLEDFIKENGWKGSYTPGRVINEAWADKGITEFGEEIEALSTVTIQLSGEVEALNMLYNFFPKAW